MSKNEKIETLINDVKNKDAWLPNGITLLRVFGPYVIPKVARAKSPIGTVIVTSGFALTDFFDGKIARAKNAETELGATLDPIVDKIFSLGLLGQAIKTRPAMAIPLVLEGIIATINASSYLKGGHPKSNTLGRLKIWPLSGAITAEYLFQATDNPIFDKLANVCIAGTVALESLNIAEYYNATKDLSDELNQENITEKSDFKITDTENLEKSIPEEVCYQGKQYIKY